MKTFFLLFALFLNQIQAQGVGNQGPEVREAQFPGGEEQMQAYFSTNMAYPENAAVRHLEGAVVLTFTIDAAGVVRNVKIRKGLGHGCDEEAIRLVQSMPGWEPATLNGQPIACGKTIQVDFTMCR